MLVQQNPLAIRAICVYCGSGPGYDPMYMQVAERFGELMAKAGISLTYGGGSLGLMGGVSKSVVKRGGKVKGFIPAHLMEREKPDVVGVDLIVTQDFHDRKMNFFNHADAFVALPGGCGTLEEVVEQLTWQQVGKSDKPILFLNTKGFWDPLFYLFDHMRETGFIRPGLTINPLIANYPDEIIPVLRGEMMSRQPCNGKGRGNPYHPDQLSFFGNQPVPISTELSALDTSHSTAH